MEAVIELVREGDEPWLIERLGVLLNDGVREEVGERVSDAVALLEDVILGVVDLLGLTEGVLERDPLLDGVALGERVLDGVTLMLAVMLGVTLLLGVWVTVLEAVLELVLEGDEPWLIERLGVLLKDGVREEVGERVSDAVAVLEGDTLAVLDLLGLTDGVLERVPLLDGVALGERVLDCVAVGDGVLDGEAVVLDVILGVLEGLVELVLEGEEVALIE